jgi:hypothetical protein
LDNKWEQLPLESKAVQKLLLLGFSIISLQITSCAQKIDVFGGYSLHRGSGWEASATGNFTRHFGLTT